MKYKLTNSDIDLIAELRSEGVKWKLIADIFKRNVHSLRCRFYEKMKAGMTK